jgi:hypothetical protein
MAYLEWVDYVIQVDDDALVEPAEEAAVTEA